MLRIKPQPTQAIEFILEEYRQIMEIELDILMKILAQFLALTKYGIYINYYWQHSSIYNINYITCDQCGLRSLTCTGEDVSALPFMLLFSVDVLHFYLLCECMSCM